MPTVIDSLVVLFNLDASQFTEGQKKALNSLKKTEDEATKHAKGIAESGKTASKFFNSLKMEAIGLFAAFAGASSLTQFTVGVVKGAAATGRLSHNLGMSTEAVSAWQGAVRQMGGTTEDANASLQTLVTGFEQIRMTGNSPLIPYLQRLGISLEDLKDPSQTLLTLADRFQALDPKDAAFLGQGMGLSPAMVNLLEKGRAEVEKYLEAQRKSFLVTQRFAENSEEAQRRLSLLRDTIAGIGATVVNNFLPAANDMEATLTRLGQSEDLKKIGRDASEAGDALKDLFSGLNINPDTVFGTLAKWLDDILKEVTHVARALSALRRGDFKGAASETGKAVSESAAADAFRNVSGVAAMPQSHDIDNPHARALLNAIAGTESAGSYNVMYGGKHFGSYADHPNVGHLITSGPNKGKVSTAAGKYQMLYSTWKEAQKALNLPDFSPTSQDRAAFWLAQRDYKRRTHRDLVTDLQSKDPKVIAGIAKALHDTWTSLPGGIEQGQSGARFASSIAGGNVTPSSLASGGSNSTSNVVHIGKIDVHTQATDAPGIARGIGGALSRYPIAAQAAQGNV